jgi:hypothetical protein
VLTHHVLVHSANIDLFLFPMIQSLLPITISAMRRVRALVSLPACILVGAVTFTVTSMQAATVVQTTPFSFTISGTESGSGTVINHTIVTLGDLTATFTPFDASLGTLESFTLAWDLTITGSISPGTGMALSGGGDGGLRMAGITYGGTGGGGGGASSGSFTLTPSKTFLVSDAGIYDSAILAAATGDSNYVVYMNMGPTLQIQNYVDGQTYEASTTGNVTMTYTYTAVPEPSTYALCAGGVMLVVVAWRRRGQLIA